MGVQVCIYFTPTEGYYSKRTERCPQLCHDRQCMHIADLASLDSELMRIRQAVRKGVKDIDCTERFVNNVSSVRDLDTAWYFASKLAIVSVSYQKH